MCELSATPEVKWYAASDQSRDLPIKVVCRKLERPVDVGLNQWFSWYRVLRLLEGIP